METKSKKIVTYSNPFEEKRKQEAMQYAMDHPESRVEDKKYSFALSSEDELMEKLKDACTRRIHSWTYRVVKCDIEIVDEENGKEGILLYGFFKYTQVIVAFICVYDYNLEKAFVFTFKKVDDTDNYDFDSLVEDFFIEHTEFQHIY